MGRVGALLCLLSAFFPTTFCYDYTVQRFRVPVDHFSFANNDSFEIRYLVNADHWLQNGGPIFFYTGNEGDITMFADNTGFMWEIAPKFQALVVFAEHRYYGESLPYGNKSYSEPKYLGYLTSQQALADYVDLITYLRSNQSSRSLSPVIAFGGSYGGMLAAWIRMKYPHIVAGSIAASAPILQFTGLTPCGAFARIIASDFQAASSECAQSIRKSWAAINNVTSSDGGRAWLSTEWRLCKPLQNSSDVAVLKDWLVDVYTNMAMVDYPYPTDFLAPIPAYPIKEACKFLDDSSRKEKLLLQSLFKSISVYLNYTGQTKCLDIKENSTPKLGDLGWDFQACTEMVMPMCSDGKHDIFEKHEWDFSEYSNTCYSRWKVRPQVDLATRIYGGKDLSSSSNIIFSNGLLDPWSSGGVMRSFSGSIIAVIIPEGAHHLDLRGSNPADPRSVTEAREMHKYVIGKWIRQFHKERKHLVLSDTLYDHSKKIVAQ